jgi:ABC-type oligopeptide transport system substrate-binding subunit
MFSYFCYVSSSWPGDLADRTSFQSSTRPYASASNAIGAANPTLDKRSPASHYTRRKTQAKEYSMNVNKPAVSMVICSHVGARANAHQTLVR